MIIENLGELIKPMIRGEIRDERAFNSSIMIIEDPDIFRALLIHELDKITIDSDHYSFSDPSKGKRLSISFRGSFLEIKDSKLYYEDIIDYNQSVLLIKGNSTEILILDIAEGTRRIQEKLKLYLKNIIKNGKKDCNNR